MRSLDELLWSWPSVTAAARTDWERGFARSIAKASKRRGWKPSPKQLQLMNRLVDALYAPNTALIEDDE